jgi:hypothetical protein
MRTTDVVINDDECAANGELLHDLDPIGTKMADSEVGIVLAFFRWIMPPKVSDPPERQHSWRWRLVAVVWFLIPAGLLAYFIAYRFLLVDGYARQSDVAALAAQTAKDFDATNALLVGVRSDVHDDRVRGTSDQLFNLRVEISHDKTDDDKQRDCKQFTNLSQLYQKLTSTPYGFEPQACDDL